MPICRLATRHDGRNSRGEGKFHAGQYREEEVRRVVRHVTDDDVNILIAVAAVQLKEDRVDEPTLVIVDNFEAFPVA